MSRKFQVKSVPSSWLGHSGRRLDCGPYMSGAIEAAELINQFKAEPLQSLTVDMFHAGREGRQYVLDAQHGIPFMGSTDILAFDLTYQPLLSKSQISRNPQFSIQKGWTLITRSGTTGRMAFARDSMDGMACSEHVMRIVPDVNRVPEGYIFAFLSSRFGIPLVTSGTYGSVIQSIEPHHICNLPVPRLGHVEEIADQMIQRAGSLLSNSQEKLNEATTLYFDSVGLKDITLTEWHSWGSDLGFSTSVDSRSLRALNFNPRFEKLCSKIRSGPHKLLGELCHEGTLRRGNIFKRIDATPEHSYQLIGQKQIFWLRPEGRWIARSSVRDEVLVPDGSILVAAQGTLGEGELFCRAEFITGSTLERAYSEHFLRVIADETQIERGALFSFIRSETSFRMLRSISTGSKLQDFHYAILPTLPIPYPDQVTRTRCNNLIMEAYESRDEALKFEDEARTLVERTIEEGTA
ncbi:methylation-associated defense system restriction endonuclease subunit S MAD5 [Microbulbifer hydrolyticus]|uniref:Restriction endonuclease subunit S n=1 Tax=Microbulbifer hydrolyticus TaxID=48074 RepID=A0A6P1T7S6_9GAMM|nr:restriction endonuclease subunit S [Microbulbifer hydrolyticus]MBB5211473.1 type I restriction enzyme S subunit [Microbulbifer hydrolyticus]QHQ37775.1 restriction endonuclease subunit S [Microbulbifer hydrolyticus]